MTIRGVIGLLKSQCDVKFSVLNFIYFMLSVVIISVSDLFYI